MAASHNDSLANRDENYSAFDELEECDIYSNGEVVQNQPGTQCKKMLKCMKRRVNNLFSSCSPFKIQKKRKNISISKGAIRLSCNYSHSLTRDSVHNTGLRLSIKSIHRNRNIEGSREEIVVPESNLTPNTIDAPSQFLASILEKTNSTVKKCYPCDDVPGLEVLANQMLIERKYEMLSKVKQSNIATLMAASFNRKFIDRLLLLEPVDFTLNYYLYHMNMELSVDESRSVVVQVTHDVLHLHYIQSNISIRNVFVQHPLNVELSSSELATDAGSVPEEFNEWNNIETVVGTSHNRIISTNKQYRKTSNVSIFSKCWSIAEFAKYLMYAVSHLNKHILHNHQTLEVLTTTTEFVHPTIWGIINNFRIHRNVSLSMITPANDIASIKESTPLNDKKNLPVFYNKSSSAVGKMKEMLQNPSESDPATVLIRQVREIINKLQSISISKCSLNRQE